MNGKDIDRIERKWVECEDRKANLIVAAIENLGQAFKDAFNTPLFFRLRNEKLNEELDKELEAIKANQKKRKKDRRC